MTKTVKVSELKIDKKLTEIRPINLVFVGRYRQAYRSGKDLGEIIVEEGTLRIVSGNHRVTALIQEYGGNHEISVTTRKFKTELDVLKTFAAHNAEHGNALSGASRRAIVLELLKEGGNEGTIANIFGVSVKRITEWAGLTVMVIGDKKKPEIKPVKAGIEGVSEMTQEQYDTHWHADRGVSAIAQAKQLIRWIENGWINDDESISVLRLLVDTVNEQFPAKKKAV